MKNDTADTLTDLSRYIYGTTRLGDEGLPFAERVEIAREVMKARCWIHTSHQYGDALSVLRAAFDTDRSSVPPAIFKIGWSSPEEVRGQISLQIEALAIDCMAIGQLCPGGPLADDLCTGGPGIAGLAKLKEEGLVGRYVMEVWPWTSDVAIRAIRNNKGAGLIDGFIFYLNPLQRFVTNELWDMLRERNTPIIAMRTVSGGDIYSIRDRASAPEYLRKRAAEVVPLYERSGCSTWTEFAVRYVFGLPQFRATVGATGRKENLAQLFATTATARPLPEEIIEELLAIQRVWSEEHDRHAAPWSM